MFSVRKYIGKIYWSLWELYEDYFARKIVKISPKTLLVLKIDAIGDYILFRNFLQVLRCSEQYKGYKITLCGNIIWKELAEVYDSDFVDEFIWVDKSKYSHTRGLFYRTRMISQIRRKGFEVLIHPTHSREFFLGDRIVALSGAKERVGSKGDNVNISEIDKKKGDSYYSRLISCLSQGDFEYYRNKEFFEKLLQRTFSDSGLSLNAAKNNNIDGYVTICPGAGAKFRQWCVNNFIDLCKKILSATKLQIILIGSSVEKNITAEISNALSSNRIEDKAGRTTLQEYVELVANAELLISNETSAVHIAAATGIQAICISNGNHFGRFNPYPSQLAAQIKTIYPKNIRMRINDFTQLVERYKHSSDEDINEITVDEVWDSVKEMLHK